jgi:predicted transcriptional regulator
MDGNIGINRDQPDLDIVPLMQQIWNDLGGTVTQSAILQEVKKIIPQYESATIRTYIPIFVRRETVKRLRAGRVV